MRPVQNYQTSVLWALFEVAIVWW